VLNRLADIEASAPVRTDLVKRAQAGDRQARDSLYHEHFPHVYGYLLEALKRHEDAEDACQHVFLKVFQTLPQYNLDGEPFSAWLFTLVRNHAIDRLRTATRTKTTATDPHELADRLASRENQAAARHSATRNIDLDAAIETLPRLQRQTLSLIYTHDFRATEAAAVLGRSPEAIRQQHRRALATLAHVIA
jgi:RNA polymerase sigma-70 factor (ECF subfamily)